MNTDIISAQDSNVISNALDVLRAGGLVTFPTDTVYRVDVIAFDGKAVESIYIAKDRPIEKTSRRFCREDSVVFTNLRDVFN